MWRKISESGEDCPTSGRRSANRAKTAPFRAGNPQIGRRLPHFGRAIHKSGEDCLTSGGQSTNRAGSPDKIEKPFRAVLLFAHLHPAFTRFNSYYFISCLKKPGVLVSNVISFFVKGCCMVSDAECRANRFTPFPFMPYILSPATGFPCSEK